MSASEIIKELPKLSEEERRAILNKLRELAQVDDDRWEEIIDDPVRCRCFALFSFAFPICHLSVKFLR